MKPLLSHSSAEIVVVDDDPAILQAVSQLIECTVDVPVHRFQSPQAALDHVLDESPRCPLVITDFDMPGMKGTELLRSLKVKFPGMHSILFSGSPEREIVESGLPSDCHYFPKPTGLSALIEAVQHLAVAA